MYEQFEDEKYLFMKKGLRVDEYFRYFLNKYNTTMCQWKCLNKLVVNLNICLMKTIVI